MNKNTSLSHVKYDFFYLKINTLQKGEFIKYLLIYEQNSTEVHSFTQYLNDEFMGFTLKNKAWNTVVNFNLRYVIMFLNYIFNASKTPIDEIESLTIEMVQEFIDKYCQGHIAMRNNHNKPNKATVSKVNTAITHFVYWLCWKKDKSRKKLYKMRFISIKDFSTYFVKVTNRDGSTRQKQRLSHLVSANPSRRNNKRAKVVQAGKYMVERLIEISLNNDPMMTWGIVLGAYAGLRQGYVTQLTDRRLKGFDEGVAFNMRLDFNYEELLRQDGIDVSNLKKKCDIPIHPGCSEVIYTFYKFHLDLLRSKGFYPNKYGALFIDDRGNAMTRSTYMQRFRKLSKILEVVITEEANMEISEAIREQRMISEAPVTQHSLRHYFKQLIDDVEKNRAATAFYMAQSSLKSQLEYAPPTALTENVRMCQGLALSVKNILVN